MVDEYVLGELSPKEKIKCEHRVQNINWIVTNKRIIKYRKSLLGDKSLRDLDFKHIVSINLEEKKHYGLFIVAGILLLLVFIFRNPVLIIMGLVIAIIVVLYVMIHRSSFYQFNAPSVNLEDWRMFDTHSKEARELIQIVRKNCFFGEKKRT